MYTDYNKPLHAGAMTPAEMVQRAARKLAQAAIAAAIVAAALAYFTIVFFVI